jgi:hypothetical protein
MANRKAVPWTVNWPWLVGLAASAGCWAFFLSAAT